MDGIKKFGRWVFTNFSHIASFIGWLVSIGFFPTLLAATSGATPLQYGVAAVAGVLVFWIVRALSARAKLWRIDARIRERISSDSSPFDPMETVYRDKRLFLKDLAPLGRKEVKGRKFINCEIIGPGDIVLDVRSSDSQPLPKIAGNWFNDVNFVQVALTGQNFIHNAVWFPDCDFEGCSLYSLNLLFVHRIREDFNWITPSVNQPALPFPGETIGGEDGEPG